MNETIYAIQEIICDKLYTCAKCPYNRGKCKAHDYASCIYAAHVKPLEDALTAAKKELEKSAAEKAMLYARVEEAGEFRERVDTRIADIMTAIRTAVTCTHDQPALEMLESERDDLRKQLAAAKKLERVLVEALEAVSPMMIPGMDWTDETGQEIKRMVRAALASVKETTNE